MPAGHRYNAPRIAIVITDGKSQHKSRTLKAARNLKNAGVKIFSVGIGSGIDWSEVHGIASTGRKRASQNWALKVNNFVEFSKSSISNQITETACSGMFLLYSLVCFSYLYY